MLRAYCERLLGWGSDQADAVDRALRAIHLSLTHQAALILRGEGDLVPVAHALHRRILGADRPFIVCDPRRGNTRASPRSPANHDSGLAAFEAATTGAVCLRASRLPRDFAELALQLRAAADVVLIVCFDVRDEESALLVRPTPIQLPPLASRDDEIDRVIAESAADALAALAAPETAFTAADHAWVRQHAATSVAEVEKATLRLAAVRSSRSLHAAAARLDLAPVSLSRWLGRRKRRLRSAGGSPA
jgi:hypothetical protein